MESITGLDATFLYAETPNSPMHVGSVAVIEGSLDFDSFRDLIKSRIHTIPKLRKRLIEVPLSIDYPYWVDDPYFDIDMHINHIALPKPGNWKSLRNIASQIFSEPLDQYRPLWSFTFVEGLDNIPQVPKGSVAIISKIHHVAIDGVAGAGMMTLLFDISPEKKKLPEPKPWKPKPLPNEVKMMYNSTMSFISKPLKFPRLVTNALSATLKTGILTRMQSLQLPTTPFSAPPTPINGIISPKRKWNSAILSLERVKALKSIMGTTLNDVILAICAGALRRYLDEKKKLPIKPLVAMVPISIRAETDTSGDGNKVSAMLVQLATNIEDPIERLEVIHENTIRAKSYQKAMGAKTLSDMAEVVPFGIANQAARLYSRYKVAEMHSPVFNVVITNVPGPQFPFYINGHKVLSVMGMAPIVDGMGLIITILSYNGLITLSSTSDVKSMPDLDNFSKYLRESANELEVCILSSQKKIIDKKSGKPVPPKSDALFLHIRKYLKKNPKAVKPGSGVFQFNITGPAKSNWKIDLESTPPSVRKGKAANSDATFTITDTHLMKIAHGKLDIQMAMVQGRLKVKGDSSKAMNLSKLLSKLPKI